MHSTPSLPRALTIQLNCLLHFRMMSCFAALNLLSRSVSNLPERAERVTLKLYYSLCTAFATLLPLQLVRDAEVLTASEVAQLPLTLLQLYKDRSVKEQQAVATHAFFDSLTKPWALEPSKLCTQVSSRAEY